MDRHLRVLKKFKESLLKLPNVLGVGVGFKQIGGEITNHLSLIVFVEKKIPAKELLRSHIVPLKVNDIETDVIEIGRVRLLNEHIQKVRPARPGVSIGHYKITAGTFGAVVQDKTTREKLILSNNHILANATDGRDGRSRIGDLILQPGPYDGGGPQDQIATLLRFIPIKRVIQEVECPVAAAAIKTGNVLLHSFRPYYDLKLVRHVQEANIVDAAVARPVAPDIIDEEILEIGFMEGVASVSPGESVQKSGRTSGLTEGNVLAVGVTVRVDIVGKEVGWFTDQVITNMISKPGDSGSLVLNFKKEALGLLFAGSNKYTVFNKIENVMEKLGVTF